MTRSSMGSTLLLLCILSLCIGFALAQVKELENAAIVTWWVGCNETTPDNLCLDTGTIFNDDDPLYLDFSTCYSNPNMEKRSINFLGRDDSDDPVMFSIIFTDEAETLHKYIPSNCNVTGACSCDSPSSLSTLRDEILAAKTCDNYPPFYECSVTPFEIKKQSCYVPATVRHTLMTGGDEFYCSMAAEIHLKSAPATTTTSNDVPTPATSPSGDGSGGLPELGYAAVMSWWPGCDETTPDDLCDDSGQVLDQEEPLYLDFDTCYSNPNMDKRSVNFLGKDDNGDPVMFSVIFTDEAETLHKYVPSDCDVTGACSCDSPSSLASLRSQILEDKTCSDLIPFYECYVTPFQAKAQSCYVPASISHALLSGGDEFYCSMAAKISLLPPSTDSHTDTSKAPASSPANSTSSSDGLSELGNAAIVSWWSGCTESTPDHYCKDTGSDLREYPLYLDFDTCYSNPNMKQRSVNFLGKSSSGDPLMFSVIFTDEAEMLHKFVPSDCNAAGACSCTQPPSLATLRKEILAAKTCSDDIPFFECYVTPFVVEKDSCYVPATISSALLNGGDEFFCSMAAEIELVPHAGSSPSTSGGAPTPTATSPSVAAPTEVAVSIPPAAAPTSCTAIIGWYDSCIDPDGDNNISPCDGASYFPLDDPLFIDLETCYQNPKQDGPTVSFYGQAESGEIMQFHIIYTGTSSTNKYKSASCSASGACECTSDLLDLKRLFLAHGGCTAGADYKCDGGEFVGGNEQCLVPSIVDSSDSGAMTWCTMIAKTKQYTPCASPPPNTTGSGDSSNNSDATMPSDTNPLSRDQRNGDLGYYAITGWYDTCSIISDDCGNEQYVSTDPLYLNLYDCYTNPKLLDQNAVTFFLKDDTGLGFSFSFFFTNKTWETYRPSDCSVGVCSCKSSDLLSSLRKDIQSTYECVDGADYSCTREIYRRPTSECFFPAQTVDSNGATKCAMAANIEHIPPKTTGGPGEADLPTAPLGTTGAGAAGQGNESGSSSGRSSVGTTFIIFAFLFAFFASSYAAVRYWRRRSDTSTMSGANDPYHYPEVWLKTTDSHDGSIFTQSQNSQFTRTSLPDSADSDGVWVSSKSRIGTINDLKFHEVT